MDSLQILTAPSPYSNLTPLYEVDPEADLLLIIPPPGLPSSSISSSTPGNTESKGIRLTVSSKHLSLVSKPFRNKLASVPKSSTQADGRIHISLSPPGEEGLGYDPKAATIALNAVHGRGSKVPRTVDLQTLTKIAYFSDKFQLFDTLEIYADRWIRNLWTDSKTAEEGLQDERDLVFWIYISYVFRQSEIFKSATKQAALGASGPIDGLGLPLRERIISESPISVLWRHGSFIIPRYPFFRWAR